MQLGIKVKDKITGFTGTVTGNVTYITGCNQALVTPRCRPDGTSDEPRWIDEVRLDRVGKTLITLEKGDNPGSDIAPPIR